MISFSDITLQLHEQILLKDSNLLIKAGDKVVIRGPSGCGKSSLLKTAVGALALHKGTVRIDDIELSTSTVYQIRSRIAFIGQEPVLGAENVRDALLLPFRYKVHEGNQPPEKEIIRLLERLHLPATILEKSSARISGGEKQRIAISRALLLGKTTFLADEITSALDPESRSAVLDELFRSDITLLSVSHDSEWIKSCGRIVEISEQKLLEMES